MLLGRWPGGATWGVVAAQAQEGLEELSHVEGQEAMKLKDACFLEEKLWAT